MLYQSGRNDSSQAPFLSCLECRYQWSENEPIFKDVVLEVAVLVLVLTHEVEQLRKPATRNGFVKLNKNTCQG